MGDEEDHLVLCVFPQICEHRVLCLPVERREGIVKDHKRARMCESPCEGEPLRLPTGKAGPAASDNCLFSVLHSDHLVPERRSVKVRRRVALTAAENIVGDVVGEKLGVVSEVADGPGDLTL